MKQLTLIFLSFVLFSTACKSTETRPNMENRPAIPEPQTIAQAIEADPERDESYSWIDEDMYNDVWTIVDEFPSAVNGLRDLQLRISKTVGNNPSEDCDKLDGERVLYRFIVNENGIISKMNNYIQEPNECAELIEITIRATQFTPGKVNGAPVSTVFGLPVKF